MKFNGKFKGYLCGVVAAATYGTNPLFALPLYSDGMTADSVLFWRYLLAAPLMALMVRWRGRDFGLPRGSMALIVVMGVLVALSSLMLFESYNYMDAGIASTLLFVYPLMVAVIMAAVYKERLSTLTICCIALALFGIALLFKGGDASLSLTGTMLVMLSSLSYSLYMIGVDRPRLRDIPTVTLIFYVLLVGAMMFGCKIIAGGGETFTLPTRWYMWGCVLAMAVLPTVVSFLCTTEAVQYIGPTPTAILGALEPVTAVVIGITVFGEVVTPRDWAGLVLIVLSVSLVVAGGRITAPLIRFRRLFPRLFSHK